MSLITVYSFRYYDPENDADRLGAGKCTSDEILRKGWVAIESSGEEIDSSLLTNTGRYHSPRGPMEPDPIDPDIDSATIDPAPPIT